MNSLNTTETNSPSAGGQLFADEFPFASQFVELDGLKYHYVDEGAGETLLLVHGNPTWSFAWRHLIRAFQTGYRVVAVDHIGCGLSDKPQRYAYRLGQHIDNLSRFVETLNLNRVTLVAHDWGGAIGMGAAARMPERFARFVLLNTAAFRARRIPWRIAVCRIPVLGALAVRGLNLFARGALRMAVAKHERMTPAVRAGYLYPYNNWHNRVAILRFVQDIPRTASHASYATLVDVERGLEQFRDAPVLLVWGDRDWCFDLEFLEEFQRRFPNAESKIVADAGHYVFEDAHEQIIPRIADFLAAHPL